MRKMKPSSKQNRVESSPGKETSDVERDDRRLFRWRSKMLPKKPWTRALAVTILYVIVAGALAAVLWRSLPSASTDADGGAHTSETIRDMIVIFGMPAAIMVSFWRGLSTDGQTEAAEQSAEAAQTNAEAAERNAEAAKSNLEIVKQEADRAEARHQLYGQEVEAAEESNRIADRHARSAEARERKQAILYGREVSALEAAADAANRQVEIAQEQFTVSAESSRAIRKAAVGQRKATTKLAKAIDRQVESTIERSELERQRILDDQFRDAMDMLQRDNMAARLGGIHVLSRLKAESQDRHGSQIVEVLCAFVRNPPGHQGSNGALPGQRADVRAALLALTVGNSDPHMRNLAGADLRGLDIRQQHPRISLRDAQLRRVDLSESVLTNVDMTGADLTGARLVEAQIDDSSLGSAILADASLVGARLVNVDLGTLEDGTRPMVDGIQVRGVICSGTTDIDALGDHLCRECGSE